MLKQNKHIVTCLVSLIMMELASKNAWAWTETDCHNLPEYARVIFTEMTKETMEIPLTTHQATILTYPEEIEVMVVNLREKRYKCYAGGPGSSATGCSYKEFPWELSLEEMEDWKAKKGKCKVGRVCPSEGSCWGSDASYCDTDKADRRSEWKETNDLLQPDGPFHISLYSTCSRTYRCSTSLMKMPIYANFDHATKEHYATFPSINGGMIRMENEKNNKLFLDGINYSYKKVSPKISTEEMSCFKTRQNVTTCTSIGNSSISLSLSKDCVGVIKTSVVSIPCTPKGSDLNDYYMSKDKIDSASSLTDLKMVSEQIMFYSAQNEHNTAKLANNLERTNELIFKILTTLVTRDPHFLGTLTGSPIKTLENTDGFSFKIQLCPHPDLSFHRTGCTPLYQKKNGIWTERNLSESCGPPISGNITEITLLNNTDLSFIELKRPKFRGASSDSESVKRFKEQMNGYATKTMSDSDFHNSNSSYESIMWLWGIEGTIRKVLSYVGGLYAVIRILSNVCALTIRKIRD